MGWNSWNFFFGKVTDKDIRDSADQIVATGMKDAGYVYVNIDDTWEGERDAEGVLHTNAKFPDMKALADYVHSKGLKLGIYSGPGPKTCAGYAGSLDHEVQDAQLYASWGIDYLKYDLCSFGKNMQDQAPNDNAAQMRLMIAAYDKMRCGSGLQLSVGICGGPLATFSPTGIVSTRSLSSSPAWRATPGPATGTIPTCSKSATANCRWQRTGATFQCGPCWPRRCWRATTCLTCGPKSRPSSPIAT
jgi:hypothetical protein